ncbi:hypothetical protein [Poritiphilus flavus]|uniref:Uncharacterized protein n=1 Tax=Poritiphilus flavus TaxID=2697053 RepID=A0A6L9E821_9FLAO|nr:hypothetical protein [Poritiphilus flavus]NAS10599.1 hypothetical protein [Poritiphilus flavus]
MNTKRKDFTPTGFIGKGENLVMDLQQENFYLVKETEFDSADSMDEIQCELLHPVENELSIEYYRYEPPRYITLEKGGLQSVLLQS